MRAWRRDRFAAFGFLLPFLQHPTSDTPVCSAGAITAAHMRTTPDLLADAITTAKRVLVATHINPDGDAIGSAVGLAHIALRQGAEARILLGGGLPDFLSWLPVPAPQVKRLTDLGDWTPDLLLLADCGEVNRAEPDLAAVLAGKDLPGPGWKALTVANIDHHVSNIGYGHINWVEPSRAATGELVGLLAERLGVPLSGELGEAIYLALVADTGNFTFANTSAGCFSLAARLAEAGLDVGKFTEKYENTWNLNKMRLWGQLLSEVTLHADGVVACCVVPRRYLADRGLTKADLDGFAAWLRRLRGVRVGLFIREDAPSVCKISLRSMGDVDMNEIAGLFGGGGHAAAAGAELALPPESAAQTVLAAIEKRL